MFLHSFPIASIALADGPNGFSLDPNLIISSLFKLNSLAISS